MILGPRFGLVHWLLTAVCLSHSVPARPQSEGVSTATGTAEDRPEAPLDYDTLTHSVTVDSFRGGSHDPSGMNDYYLTATMIGLLNTSEERNLPLEQRKRVEVPLGEFGATKLAALGFWRPDEKTHEVKELRVKGDQIRELAARVMRELGQKESGVAVMVDLALYEKAKRFFFFGADTLVARVTYYAIPPTKFDHPLRTNNNLTLTDDRGTQVQLSIRYVSPAAAAARG